MLNEGKSKQILLSVLGVAILVVAVVGISYAAFTANDTSAVNTISTGSILMTYAQPDASLSITNANNMSASNAYAGANHFDFSLSATTNAAISFPYEITVTPTVSNQTFAGQVRIGLKKGGVVVTNANFQIGAANVDYSDGVLANTLPATEIAARATVSKTLYKGTLLTAGTGTSFTATETFSVYLWIDETTVLGGTAESYSILVNVDASAAPLDV